MLRCFSFKAPTGDLKGIMLERDPCTGNVCFFTHPFKAVILFDKILLGNICLDQKNLDSLHKWEKNAG